ncbi:MAG: DUF1446 domain-containing protein [Treponema sp.]|nr:DUF1446 domain-containing protein [Treponema sp.]
MKTIRIGSGAGTALDLVEPAVELLEKGNLDYLCFECLAERTLAWANLEKLEDPAKGYNSILEFRMGKILDSYKKIGSKTKIISNMGAANPHAAMLKIAEIAKEKGLKGLKVAAVIGDDVLAKVNDFLDLTVMETGVKLAEHKDSIVSANAYIGAAGIIEALKNGADIVVAGRVADPTLFLAPAIHEFGWKMDDWDKLASGTIAGHLLECSSMITGGYFADPEYGKISENLWKIGFPIGILYENGNLEITKVEGSGGVVNTMTVKEQLTYEINNPAEYLTPDCILSFLDVEVVQLGKDHVSIKGARGKPKTGKLKLNVGYRDCFIGEGEITYGGPTCVNRAKIAAEFVKKRLELTGVKYSEIRCDLIGLSSIFDEKLGVEWSAGKNAEVRLRVAARTKDRENALRIGREVEALPMAGPAGGGAHRGVVREILSIASVLIDENMVKQTVEYQEV